MHVEQSQGFQFNGTVSIFIWKFEKYLIYHSSGL